MFLHWISSSSVNECVLRLCAYQFSVFLLPEKLI
uniref:Uncharacterized protein n=2 Tax=Setaria TaxID=4554 RepID=K3YFS0_SETIT